jgi:hypothetical protein
MLQAHFGALLAHQCFAAPHLIGTRCMPPRKSLVGSQARIVRLETGGVKWKSSC